MASQRGLTLERGRLVANGPISTVMERFLSKTERIVEFDGLVRPDAPEHTEGRSDDESVPLAAGTLTSGADSVAFPPQRLLPMQDWHDKVKRAERAWEKVIQRWRSKASPKARAVFQKPGTDHRGLVSITVHIYVRGDIRAQFDEERQLAGEAATSIFSPGPAFVEAPEEIAGFDPTMDFSIPARTAWQNVNRCPALRPRLRWMVYRVVAEASAPEAEGKPAFDPADTRNLIG